MSRYVYTKGNRYGHVPGDFFDLGYAHNLPRVASLFYVCLCYHYNLETGQCDPSRRLLGYEGGLGNKTMRKSIRMLVKVELIEVSPQNRYEDSQRYKPVNYTIKEIEKPCPPKEIIKQWWAEISDEIDKPRGHRDLTANGSKNGLNQGGREVIATPSREVIATPAREVIGASEHRTLTTNKNKEQVSNQKKDSTPSPLDGFEKSKAKPKTPQDKKPKLSSRENEGTESSAESKPQRGEHFLSLVEGIRELLESMGPQQLKNYLIKKGYDPQVVEEALEKAKEISPGTRGESEDKPEAGDNLSKEPKNKRGGRPEPTTQEIDRGSKEEKIMAFIRKRIVKGKAYYQVLESYREDGEVKKRVVCNLGRHSSPEKALIDARECGDEERVKQLESVVSMCGVNHRGVKGVVSRNVVSKPAAKKVEKRGPERKPASLLDLLKKKLISMMIGRVKDVTSEDLAEALLPDLTVEQAQRLSEYLEGHKDIEIDIYLEEAGRIGKFGGSPGGSSGKN